ncbi:MAG: glycosyl hydrolase family 28 protein [Saccharofermentanales bacterium]
MRLPSEIIQVEDMHSFIDQGLDATSAFPAGISVSPYFKVKSGIGELPVYCVPVTLGGPHNFAMADVSSNRFPVEIEIETDFDLSDAIVIPEKYGIKTKNENRKVIFTITGFGKYTVIFNDSHVNPLTVFIREEEEFIPLDGYKIIKYGQGIHYVDFIEIKGKTILYLESGALLIPNQPDRSEVPLQDPDWAGMKRYNAFIRVNDAEDVKITGHGVIDFTTLDWHMRSPVLIKNCKNIEVEGITLINAPEWNITCFNSRDVKMRDIIIFGYRQNSDGINIVNSRDVSVDDCFIRSGDDLFGVKSMDSKLETGGRNIHFKDCIAWPDKVRGFGIVHETVSDISDVYFNDCCVLYRFSNWMDELGSLVVIASGKGDISNIHFKDIEIHYDIKYPINCSFIKDEFNPKVNTVYGNIKNIYFENIRYNSGCKIRLKGQDNRSKLDYIYFKDIYRDGIKAETLEMLDLKKNEFVGDNIII